MLPMGFNEIGDIHEHSADAYYAIAQTVALPTTSWEVLHTTSNFRSSGGETVTGMFDGLVYRSKAMALAGSPSEAVIPDDQYSFLIMEPSGVTYEVGDRFRDPLDHTLVFTIKTIMLTDLLYTEGVLEKKVTT